MSAKQNKMPGWKEDFLQWERSGAPANDMVWEKLQPRLQSRRKKSLIYLLPAAAILLLILGLGYFFFINNKKATGSTAKTPGVSVKQTTPLAKSSAAPLNSVKEPLPSKQTEKQQRKIIVDVIKKNDPVLLPEKIALPENVTSIEPKQLTFDTLKPIIAEAPKKKLKVVHMNEWNAPPPPTYAAIKEAWENETKRIQEEMHEPDQPAPNKKWSLFSPRN